MRTLMAHDENPAQVLREKIGDISGIEVFNNQLLVAVYIRPQQTKGGIFMPDTALDEDKYQGKVGLVLAKGPTAFKDANNEWFQGVDIEVGDWVVFKPSDGWGMTINKNMCRMLDDVAVRGRVSQPDLVW